MTDTADIITPRVLHQTWKDHAPPPPLDGYMTTCRSMNEEAGFTYAFYDDTALRRAVADAVPQHLPLYDAFAHTIERVDFARYAIMWKTGGVYLDADMECYKPLETFLAANDGRALLTTEPAAHAGLYDKFYPGGVSRVVCNAAMASPPGHPFWLSLMDFIADHYSYSPTSNPVLSTGPMAITRCIQSAGGDVAAGVTVLDHCAFLSRNDDPVVGADPAQVCPERRIYAVHRWANTWVTDTRVARWRHHMSSVVFCVLVAAVCVVACTLALRLLWRRPSRANKRNILGCSTYELSVGQK